MILNGKKVSAGWLLVLVALVAVGVLGLRTEFSDSLFDLPAITFGQMSHG